MKYIFSVLALALAASATPLEARDDQVQTQPPANVLNVGVRFEDRQEGRNIRIQAPMNVLTPMQAGPEYTHVECSAPTGNMFACNVTLRSNGALIGKCMSNSGPQPVNDPTAEADWSVYCYMT